MRRTAAGVLALATAVLAPASAQAATTIGQVFTPTAETKATVVQTGVASGVGYTVPSDGVITSWSFQSETVASTVRLKAVRRGDDGTHVVVGESEPQTTNPNQLQSFQTRVPVKVGDFIGTAASAGKSVAYTGANEDTVVLAPGDQPVGAPTNYSNVQGIRVNVTASLEPDADADGFGDETQDLCTNDPAVQTACSGDLTLRARAERSSAFPGGEVVFLLTVANAGPSRSVGVRVVADLSEELRLVGTEGAGCTAGPPLTCQVPDVGKDGTATIRLVARAVGTGIGSVAARVSATTVDPSAANNAAGAFLEIENRPGRCANAGTVEDGSLRGTRSGDLIVGTLGRDLLIGLAGADCLFGGDGNDRLMGDEGNDTLEGGAGHDRISGGSGTDTIKGDDGNDRISGGSGIDTITGDDGNDRIEAVDRKRDTIDCGAGRDTARVDRGDRVKRCERVIRAKRRR